MGKRPGEELGPPAKKSVLPAEKQRILVVDFGSQVTHVIARRIREAEVYCEVISCTADFAKMRDFAPAGFVLSGGPSSVYDAGAPHMNAEFWRYVRENKTPVLGICYGAQEMTWALGGKVEGSTKREFGRANVTIKKKDGVFQHAEIGKRVAGKEALEEEVWMSHGDKITALPKGFEVLASTASCEFAAMRSEDGLFTGVQFHPEVTHTPNGYFMIEGFVRGCGCDALWTMQSFAEKEVEKLRAQIGDKHVVGAISGGVDSSVGAALLKRAVGDKFHAFMIDTGLLRKDEAAECHKRLNADIPGLNLTVIDKSAEFFAALRGERDPEKKRKTIGKLFIDAFEEAVKMMKLPEDSFLLQGTLYPDVIESTSFRGPSTTIKTHHNVGGLPEKMKLRLCEPLRLLFKDEVRRLGKQLHLSELSIMRHPFPGPGLAVRILDDITPEKVKCLQEADHIFIEELRASGEYAKIGQAFVVLLPTVKTVGVMGDHRTYEWVCCLRAVDTSDFMTADWHHLPYDLTSKVSGRIINEVKGINRVCLDVSSKPPATIEWE